MCQPQIFKSWNGPSTSSVATKFVGDVTARRPSVPSGHHGEQIWPPPIEVESSSVPSSSSPFACTQSAGILELPISLQHPMGPDFQVQSTPRNENQLSPAAAVTQAFDELCSPDNSGAGQLTEKYSFPDHYDSSDFATDPVTQALIHAAAPGLLYCPIPWPDDMLASPPRQFLWQYFLYSMEAYALCLDPEDVSL